MKILAWVGRIFSWAFYPVHINAAFFAFMYALGVICAWLTVPNTRGAHLYEHTYTELFVDLYAVCVLLALIPHRVRLWIKALLYLLLRQIRLDHHTDNASARGRNRRSRGK